MSGWYRLSRDRHDPNQWSYGGTMKFRMTPEGEIDYMRTDRSESVQSRLPNIRIEESGLVIDFEDLADLVLRSLERPEIFMQCLRNPEFRKEVFDTITEKYNHLGFGKNEWNEILMRTRENLVSAYAGDLARDISMLGSRVRAMQERIKFMDYVNGVMAGLDVKNEKGEPLRFKVPDEYRLEGEPWFSDQETWSAWVRSVLEAKPGDVEALRKKFMDELARQGVAFGEGSTGLMKIHDWFDLTDMVLALVGRVKAPEVEEKKDDREVLF